MSFQLPTESEKASYVQQQFDRIARRYDLTNDAISLGMHRLWKERAVDCLRVKPGGCYLDVCCGTGDLALTIARRLAGPGSVTGLDFSRNMLAVAAQRANRAQMRGPLPGTVNWCEGDAENLPFADNSFDGAIISFGLRNLAHLSRGIAEMARVVRPGGAVVNLDLGHPSLPVFAPLFLFYFGKIVPLIGHWLQADRQAYTYLPESLKTYPPPAAISRLFKEAGLVNVVHRPLAFGSVALHVGIVP